MNGSSMWVCGSMPPGMTSAPPASTTVAPAGACRSGPTARIKPPSHSTSALMLLSALTTVPPRIRTLLMVFSLSSFDSGDRSRFCALADHRQLVGFGQHRLEQHVAAGLDPLRLGVFDLVVADAADAGHEDHRRGRDFRHVAGVVAGARNDVA